MQILETIRTHKEMSADENFHNTYQSPFSHRYASQAMRSLFSPQKKHSTWRAIWIALAESQKELGLPISEEQIQQMLQHKETIDFNLAEQFEKELQHDVMAHIHTFGVDCPLAKPIIHLGATSCLITDNAELILMNEGLSLIQGKLIDLIQALSAKANRYKELPTLSYTHFKPAQPTTVGKRFAMWLQDFWLDLEELKYRQSSFRFLGIKGATGTQASFLELFKGDQHKVKSLESLMAKKLGFQHVFPISGQTYTRKQDSMVLNVLSGIAASSHKMCTDLRLLAHKEEIEESFNKNQVGSTAMPYKRNPMASERVCSLARYVISLAENPAYTSATQWLERTLDDSANRRLCIPEAFLAIDAILDLTIKIINHLTVHEKVIEKNLYKEIPFLLTENILMAAVKKGADRQETHEILKQLSHEVAHQIKSHGADNDLLDRIANHSSIPLSKEEIDGIIKSGSLTGRAAEQVTEFLHQIRDQ
jgi:adenylosuccinate lyase